MPSEALQTDLTLWIPWEAVKETELWQKKILKTIAGAQLLAMRKKKS